MPDNHEGHQIRPLLHIKGGPHGEQYGYCTVCETFIIVGNNALDQILITLKLDKDWAVSGKGNP